MKFLLANKFFYLKGGSEQVFFQERNYLLKAGHNVVDFSMADERNFDSITSANFVANINFKESTGTLSKISQAVSFVHSSSAVERVDSLVRTEMPEVAHLHNIYHQLTPSIIPVLKKYGVKVALTLHDTKLVCPGYLSLRQGEICNECQGRKFWKPLTTHCQNSRSQELLLTAEALFHQWRGSYDGVDIFLAPSQFLADLTSQRIPKEKIRVLRNGIDVKEYQPHYDDKGYGLYFGRLSKEKGIRTLLEAQSRAPQALPLKVVGTGPLKETLEKEFSGVEFLGYKSGDELNDLVRNAAYVVVPSEWYENCSMVVLESMAFGKPIIGSRIGGIPEQIEDGKTGLLFEMGNARELAEKMTLLSENKELRLTYGRAAREKLEREFSLEDHCNKLVKIYEELLEGKV